MPGQGRESGGGTTLRLPPPRPAGPPPRPAGPPRGPVRFLRQACAGIVVFVLVGMFTGHGSVQVFAEGAFAVGLGWAVLCAVAGLLTRVPWREVVGVAAIAMFVSSLIEDAHVLPRRWR